MSAIQLEKNLFYSLEQKCKKYNKEGIRFAKWRSVFEINENKCSDSTILDNCHSLAKYARICQENNIVPIIEPEIIMDGNHNIYTTAKNQEKILWICLEVKNQD